MFCVSVLLCCVCSIVLFLSLKFYVFKSKFSLSRGYLDCFLFFILESSLMNVVEMVSPFLLSLFWYLVVLIFYSKKGLKFDVAKSIQNFYDIVKDIPKFVERLYRIGNFEIQCCQIHSKIA